jgi:alkylhydroperoxidase family enzyme
MRRNLSSHFLRKTTHQHRAYLTPTSALKMRLPYVPNPPPTTDPEEARIVSAIEARRAPRPLQPLDLTLLHSPPVADGWNSFLGAIRTRTSLPQDIRELAISRVAVVNRAWYEWSHHAPLAVAGGVREELMEKVKVPQALGLEGVEGEEEGRKGKEGFEDRQWLALVYTDEMTRNVQVREETFDALKRVFSEKEVVELTATVACYNCVSRFLVALDGKFYVDLSCTYWATVVAGAEAAC